jgi:membrane-bound lytic murein transglycosylase B
VRVLCAALAVLAATPVARGPLAAVAAAPRGGTRLHAVAQSEPEARPSFAEFLDGVRTEALARGIRPEIVDEALSGIQEPLAVVIARDRAQTESVLTLEQYVARRLTSRFIRAGRENLARHRTLLDDVAARYGVPPEIVASVWGLESNFGRFSGVRPTIAALATLAWDPRRPALFRKELLDALEILNRGDIGVAQLKGSWAGAMGQTQFMPSSYLKFAEDYDGDGRRDIWATPADVFASIANFLRGAGWAGTRWGREVSLPAEAGRRIANEVRRRDGTCRATRDMTVALPPARWRDLGVRARGDRALPDDMPDAALVSGSTRHFLVYSNYDALLEYNCAHAYAISVALLADRLADQASAGARAGQDH